MGIVELGNQGEFSKSFHRGSTVRFETLDCCRFASRKIHSRGYQTLPTLLNGHQMLQSSHELSFYLRINLAKFCSRKRDRKCGAVLLMVCFPISFLALSAAVESVRATRAALHWRCIILVLILAHPVITFTRRWRKSCHLHKSETREELAFRL